MKNAHIIILIVAFLLSAQAKGLVADSWQFPLGGDWFDASNRQGYCFGETSGTDRYHLGEDIWRNSEAPVYACGNGVVKVATYTSDPYPVVVIEHDLGGGVFACSVYYHIHYTGYVSLGQQVSKGDQIGYVSLVPSDYGGSGSVPHLHFGIRSGAYSAVPESDGVWKYRGYGPSSVAGSWYSPSHFVSGTTLLIDEYGLFFNRNGSSWNEISSTSVGWGQHVWWTYASDSPTTDCWGKWDLSGIRNYQEGRFLAGDYEVFAFIPSNGANSKMAKYEIKHSGTTSYRTIDQSPHSNEWVSLGTYNFSSSGDQYVRLNDNTGENLSLHRMIGYDAIKFVRTTSGDITPPTISAFTATPSSVPLGSYFSTIPHLLKTAGFAPVSRSALRDLGRPQFRFFATPSLERIRADSIGQALLSFVACQVLSHSNPAR